VEVAPRTRSRLPLERVRREVGVLELDLFFDRGRILMVHRAQERHYLHLCLVVTLAALEARVDAVARGPVAGERARLEALPVRQRATPGGGRRPGHEVRGARRAEREAGGR